jgi:7-cyano-7-deazaguanine synthase
MKKAVVLLSGGLDSVIALALAMRDGFEGHALLVRVTKAQIILAGIEAGIDFSQTVSCYQADGAGSACGVCDSCRIRRAGSAVAGIPDPTRYLHYA